MIGRRHFLKLGPATLTGALALDWSTASAARTKDGNAKFSRALFDRRFAESTAFAASLAACGVATTALPADVSTLWYSDLRRTLEQQRRPLLGLTDRSALFCFEELARDVGMSVAARIDHVIDSDGNVLHEATGPASWAAPIGSLTPQQRFGDLTAMLVSQALPQRIAAAQKLTGPAAPSGYVGLVSWVIS